MATLTHYKGGRYRIQFTDQAGKRQSIQLGKCPKAVAESVKSRIESLIATKIMGDSPEPHIAAWLAKLDKVMADKLAHVGLIAPKRFATLEAFVTEWIEGRTDVEERTRAAWRFTLSTLVEMFGADCPLNAITAGNATEWQQSRVRAGQAPATVRKEVGHVKRFFNEAVDHEVIAKNPFAKLKSGSIANPERSAFITQGSIGKVIDALPNANCRLIVALARYGGLRITSELVNLKWSDVLWSENKFRVVSPKTKKQGKPDRYVPLFPELRPYFDECFANLPERAGDLILPRDLLEPLVARRLLEKAIAAAGLEQWPRIFHNLRASRQTELSESFPAHVVCAWLGNSQQIAAKHYLQVTDDHFEKAACVQSLCSQPATGRDCTRQADVTSAAENSEDPEKHSVSSVSASSRRPAPGVLV